MDVEHASASEAIDAFINKRARDGEAANAEEGLWAASDRKHRAEQQRGLREAWACYHAHMSKLHASLSAEHRTKSEALCDEPDG